MSNSTPMVISIPDICTRTGFAQDDILAELQNKGIAPIHMGNNNYFSVNMISALFQQNGIIDFVTNQPNYQTDIDNHPSSELSLPQAKGKEVKRVANATISFINNEKRKKPYLVQWRIYFADGSDTRKSKSFATIEEAEAYAAKVDREREQVSSPYETAQASNKEPLGLSVDYATMPIPAVSRTGIVCAQAVSGNMAFYDYMLYYIKDSGKCNCLDRTKKCYTYVAANILTELEEIVGVTRS